MTPGVTRTTLHAASGPDAVRVDRISYSGGAHTHWHLHTGEQVLYGEDGTGWIRFAERSRVVITPGEIVHVAAGSRHWHGATPDGAFTHLAVTAGGDTVWLGEVTPAEHEAD